MWAMGLCDMSQNLIVICRELFCRKLNNVTIHNLVKNYECTWSLHTGCTVIRYGRKLSRTNKRTNEAEYRDCFLRRQSKWFEMSDTNCCAYFCGAFFRFSNEYCCHGEVILETWMLQLTHSTILYFSIECMDSQWTKYISPSASMRAK